MLASLPFTSSPFLQGTTSMRWSAKSAVAFLFVMMAGASSVVGQNDVENQQVADGKRGETYGRGERWAVVIGVNEYPNPIPWLRYCVDDAALLARTLEEHCGFQDHVLILATNQPGGPN